MEITRNNWRQYIQNLAKADDKAAEMVTSYLQSHEIASEAGFQAFVDYYYAVVTKYAEGASEMAAQAYEALAEAQGATIKSAMPAETPSKGECVKTIRGTMLDSDRVKSLAQTAGRLVRRTGVDTTINNALRDGAEWAWVPSGDTCAFCMMLASNGWQRASKKAIKNGHASHIHANCDCTYAIRFDGKSTVEGYDPDYYKALYDNAEGTRWQDKLNSMRRDKYAQNKDKINAQKRAAYALRTKTAGPIIIGRPGRSDLGNSSKIEDAFLPKSIWEKLPEIKKIKTYDEAKKWFEEKGIELDTDLAVLKTEKSGEEIPAVRDTLQQLITAHQAYTDLYGEHSLDALKRIVVYSEDETSRLAYYYNKIGENDPLAGTMKIKQWSNSNYEIFHEYAHAFQDSMKMNGEDAVTYAERVTKQAKLDESIKAYTGAKRDVIEAERMADALGKGFAEGYDKQVEFIKELKRVTKSK